MKSLKSLLPALVLVIGGCQLTHQPKPVENLPTDAVNSETSTDKKVTGGGYLGGDFKGNYVWGGAMNLAWTELNDNILHGKLILRSDDKKALATVDIFNNPVFTKNDLDEKSYYVKSGYGPETEKTINTETRKKFPTKTFEDLHLDLDPTDIISYAYFLKEVEYQAVFEKDAVTFEGKKVKGFFAQKPSQKATVRIVRYESDDKFIVSLKLKDENDELLLAKGYDMNSPDSIINTLAKSEQKSYPAIGKSDLFAAPEIHLSHNRKYLELIGKPLGNKGFESYKFSEVFENIKFDMDEKGARVENEAVITMTKSAVIEPEQPKKFLLDKPYWVIMKRKSSQNPYFILGVKNREMMKDSAK